MLRTAVIAVSAAGIIAAIVWHGSVHTVRTNAGLLIYDRWNQTIETCGTLAFDVSNGTVSAPCNGPNRISRD